METALLPRLSRVTGKYQIFLLAVLVLVGLAMVGRANYLLFHTLSELFSIIIACTIFVLTWNGRRFLNNGTLLVLGISFLCVAGLDLAHTLAFRGMNIFPQAADANLATQLWLSARAVQAVALVAAPVFLRHKVNPYLALAGFALPSVGLGVLAFQGFFPQTNLAEGLTTFKVVFEYTVILVYLIGIALLWRVRNAFDHYVIQLLISSVLVNVVAEVFFTQYLQPEDVGNLLGHYFKIISVYLIYQAIIATGFLRPYDLLFRDLKNSEAALRESEARERARAVQMEAIMAAVPAIVWIAHDPKAEKVTGNQAAAKLLQMPMDANPSKTAPNGEGPTHFRVFQNGKELAPEELPLQVAAASGKAVQDFEEKIVFADGEERHLLGNVSPLLNEAGQPAGAVAAFIDISERVQAENALQESERRFRGLFEAMAEGFVLVEVIFEGDRAVDYRFLEINPAFERFANIKREQILGKKMSEIAPDFNAAWKEIFAHVVRTGEPGRYEDYLPDLGKHFEALINPMGKNVCSVLTIDVTERRENQEALRQSEARLRRLVESNIIGVIYADADGNISLANDAFLDTIGYTREELEAGQVNWRAMTPPEYLSLDEKGVIEAKERGACTPYMKEYIRKDGSHVPILIGYAHFNEAGGPYICFIINLTEQKRAEAEAKAYAAQLERSNRELQDFAFVASHDLQEPLRKIQAFGERLERRMKEKLDAESTDYLERMLSAANRMRVMINDLLSLSRVTTQGRPFEQVSMNNIVSEVLSDLEFRIERTGACVEVGDLPVIEADPTQMQQLMQNLIGNAIKFHRPEIPPQVQVWAECQPDGKQVQLFVKDNGVGFEEEYLERIFQPFQRLHGAGKYEGSGIGLAVCRKIVERHSGDITAKSKLGEGSTFIITLLTRQSNRRE